MRYCTPLRYPGGKNKLSNFIQLIFEENDLLDGHYIEPFAGSAAVAFRLLFSEYVSQIHINDISASLFAFWHSVLNNTENLCKLINDTPVNVDQWRKQKYIQEHPDGHSLLEYGFSTFFLNRTNRSGIIGGGVIGGLNQDGPWKIDARFTKPNLLERIEKIARYKKRINLYKSDAANFINQVLPKIDSKSLVYLDPPYYVKGKDLYENYYNHDDHERISKLISRIKQHWVVSYDYTKEIVNFYQNFRNCVYGINYSAANRYQGAEIMFFSDSLVMPSVEDPTKAKVA